jgi:hypothetical protein
MKATVQKILRLNSVEGETRFAAVERYSSEV